MTRRKKNIDGSQSANDANPRGAHRDVAAGTSEQTPSARIEWKTVSLYLLAALVVLFVFVPWVQRFIDGQFFGTTGDYGTDFFRYAQGSLGLIQLGIDPYSDQSMFHALEDGRLATDHPNPFYDEQMIARGFGDSWNPVARGVVSPPFLLVIIYPLVRLCGYTLALNVWTVAGFLGIGWLSVQFWRKLTPPSSPGKQLAALGAMLSLLVFSSFPVMWSAVYGQFEVIYFLAIGGAVYLWIYRRHDRSTPLLIGLLLAIGGSVKLFPLLLLGYFFWQVVRFRRNAAGDSDSHLDLSTLPEWRVCLWGVFFFVAINLVTGVLLGFEIYGSFLVKVADLRVEGTGPSMKGNLLSYLNFASVWLSGPFAPMDGKMWLLYAAIAGVVIVFIARSIRSTVGRKRLTRQDQWIGLLELTLIVAALPTILPHWWIYYNVILILPLMVCFVAAKNTADKRVRRCIFALTAFSFVLTFSYLTTAVFFGAFPTIYQVLINQAGVDAALAEAAAKPALLENLVYSSAYGRPFEVEFEGRVVSLFNLLYGYPGTVCLLVASWLALRSYRRETSRRADGPAASTNVDSHNMSRRGVLLTLAAGALLCFAGGYGLGWEGSRRLASIPHVDFVTDEHSIKEPDQYVDRLLQRLSDIENRPVKTGGLVLDLLPPNHFIEAVRRADPVLATAILSQNRAYFDDPLVVDKLLTLFARYQANLSTQYSSCFDHSERPASLAWRYDAYPGGILAVLERECRKRNIPLRRGEQEWTQWQLRFLYEYNWQRAFEYWGRKDPVEFAKSIMEHQRVLDGYQELMEDRLIQVRVSLFQNTMETGDWRPGFVYVQRPAFTVLSSYAACSELNDNMLVEQVIHVGTLYVVEELLRRARLAKSNDPYEALRFAKTTVSQFEDRHILQWWLTQAAGSPEEILHRLSEDGFLDADQIESQGLLFWDQTLGQFPRPGN